MRQRPKPVVWLITELPCPPATFKLNPSSGGLATLLPSPERVKRGSFGLHSSAHGAITNLIDSVGNLQMADTGTIEVQMPQMGESVTEGTILEWHVSEGEEVAEGDTVVEVSTDKIDAEVPAPASGVITKIMASPDDTVEVGQVLAQIDPNGTAAPAASSDTGPAADAPGNGGDPSPLTEQDGLIMGGGEGDLDLGDDDVEAKSSEPGELDTSSPTLG